MKARKEKIVVAARETKRRLDNPFSEAEKAEKSVAQAERRRKIHRTADEKCERARVEAERRCAAGVEGLAAEATRKSSRRKCHPLTNEQKFEKARVNDARRSAIKLTFEQKSEKTRVEA
jgi:hypothetical protein